MASEILTADKLREHLHYDAGTGIFTRRITTGRHGRWKAGTRTGCINKRGYVVVRIGRTLYYGHLLAWLYVHGDFPEKGIAHLDEQPAHNAIKNLEPSRQRITR